MDRSQVSMTAERGSSRNRDTRRGEKKPEHKFSHGVPSSNSYGMEQLMREKQGPGGTAPWAPVWSFPKSGGGNRK